MKASLLACAFLAVAACCGGPAVPATKPLQLPDVIKLTGEPGEASAVPLTSTWLLTCKHAMPMAKAGDASIVQIIEHPDFDLALIRIVEPRNWVCVQLSNVRPALGARLIAGGYHLGDYLLWTDGRQGGSAGSMSCPVIFGASGGPVLNERGELVGVIQSLSYLASPMFPQLELPLPHCSDMTPVVELRSWIESNIR